LTFLPFSKCRADTILNLPIAAYKLNSTRGFDPQPPVYAILTDLHDFYFISFNGSKFACTAPITVPIESRLGFMEGMMAGASFYCSLGRILSSNFPDKLRSSFSPYCFTHISRFWQQWKKDRGHERRKAMCVLSTPLYQSLLLTLFKISNHSSAAEGDEILQASDVPMVCFLHISSAYFIDYSALKPSRPSFKKWSAALLKASQAQEVLSHCDHSSVNQWEADGTRGLAYLRER
jgi:hypothetical protein